MSALLPVAVYGLKVPAGDVMIPALVDFPATFRITMAAIDPSAEPKESGTANSSKQPRATLKMVYDPAGPGDEEDSEEEDDDDDEEGYLKALLGGNASDDEDDEDDSEDDDESSDEEEEKNGGPSDPAKTQKARKQAALEQIMAAMGEEEDDEEDEMDLDAAPKVNGFAKQVEKGKGKAPDLEGEEGEEVDLEDDDENDLEELGMEEVVICTLDPEKNYQQTLDITIPEEQNAYFKVSGTHAIYLTGNYVIPADSGHSRRRDEDPDMYDDSEEENDLEPDEDELDDDGESDELDDLEDPRITELGSDEELEVPELVKKLEPAKKGKNKRPAEDSEEEPANLDEIMAKALRSESTIEEPKLSKKQLKKQKKNDGKSAEVAAGVVKDKAGDKKVQFAKNLEAPSSASSSSKPNGDSKTGKAQLGVKMVQGVKIDDKKTGKGPVAKHGNMVDMRYIGKLKDGKVFDSNKSGKPFSFKLGANEVIKGWEIGIVGMSAGGERRITVPANLAYGKKALPGIPSNSELIFDVKLLALK